MRCSVSERVTIVRLSISKRNKVATNEGIGRRSWSYSSSHFLFLVVFDYEWSPCTSSCPSHWCWYVVPRPREQAEEEKEGFFIWSKRWCRFFFEKHEVDHRWPIGSLLKDIEVMTDTERMITSRNIERTLSSPVFGVQIEVDDEYIDRHDGSRKIPSEHSSRNHMSIGSTSLICALFSLQLGNRILYSLDRPQPSLWTYFAPLKLRISIALARSAVKWSGTDVYTISFDGRISVGLWPSGKGFSHSHHRLSGRVRQVLVDVVSRRRFECLWANDMS